MAESELTLKSPLIMITPSDEQDLWEKDWIITLAKEPEKKIGIVHFRGEKALGAVPFHVELEEEYQNKHYGTECIGMIVSWVFHFGNIYEIKAEADRENDKAIKALKKNGFILRSSEGRNEYYSVLKPKTAWTGLYLFIGIALGLILGIIISKLLVGMIVGVVIGVSIGLSMDSAANKEREKVTGKSLKH